MKYINYCVDSLERVCRERLGFSEGLTEGVSAYLLGTFGGLLVSPLILLIQFALT